MARALKRKGPGGARPGAGRKPSGKPQLGTVAIRFAAEDLAKVDAAAEAVGETRSDFVRRASIERAQTAVRR